MDWCSALGKDSPRSHRFTVLLPGLPAGGAYKPSATESSVRLTPQRAQTADTAAAAAARRSSFAIVSASCIAPSEIDNELALLLTSPPQQANLARVGRLACPS